MQVQQRRIEKWQSRREELVKQLREKEELISTLQPRRSFSAATVAQWLDLTTFAQNVATTMVRISFTSKKANNLS